MKGFLSYIDRDSVLHRLNPLTKFLLAVLICIGCFSCESRILLVVFLIFGILIGAVGKIFPQTMRLFIGLIKLSIFLFILQVLFVQSGSVIVSLPLGILITDHGFEVALTVVLKLMGATLPLAIMLLVTKLTDLSNVLVSKMHIPYQYAFAVTSAIRFVPQFSDDIQDIIEAQKARGVDLDTKNAFKKIGLIVPLCIPLLITSVKKTDSAAIAARLRGFNLRKWDSCFSVPAFHIRDIVVTIMGVAVAAVGIIF